MSKKKGKRGEERKGKGGRGREGAAKPACGPVRTWLHSTSCITTNQPVWNMNKYLKFS